MIVWQTGADLGAALAALYNASKPVGFGLAQYDPEEMTPQQGWRELRQGAFVDYCKGRPIKMNFEEETPCRVDLYDGLNGGDGAAVTALHKAGVSGWRQKLPLLPNPPGT